MFQTKRIVEFADTDMAGIVHFAEFFRYLEAAEHAYLRGCGVNVFLDWEGQRLTFPRVSASCDYVHPARFGDELTIEVSIDRLGRTSARYAFTVLKGTELVAKGQITAVLCRVRDDRSLEPFPFPDALRDKLLQGPR
ncbi:MAG: thioesterase family protein [Gemmataceae bacterium]